MKYMGSKNRHAKELLPIILKNRKQGQYYVEPFCGRCNMIDKVDGPRIANDNHFYLIKLLESIAIGWIPPNFITENEYKWAKQSNEISPHLRGFIGFCCSYSGKYFGGFARGNDSKGNPRNYCAEQKRNLTKQAPNLKGIEFFNMDYRNLPIPANSIIYCDPPYASTTKYSSGDFDHEEFWQWVRDKSKEGHEVFVSEYNAPDDFEVLWEKKVNNTLAKDTGSKQGVEKLFKYKG